MAQLAHMLGRAANRAGAHSPTILKGAAYVRDTIALVDMYGDI